MFMDLSGQKFEDLTVVRKSEKQTGKETQWLCRCACGRETTASTYELRSGHKKSCGCRKSRPKAHDLTGMRFGRLTVIKRVGTINRRPIWHCKCDCGKFTDVRSVDLKSGNTKSCGCMGKHQALYH